LNIKTMPVFPAADAFPMLDADGLEELAADIKQHGLRDPLVVADVDGKTLLVDGRNRRRACDMAGVEPSVVNLNGDDPTAYVLSANVHRRHMTKGQRAMAVATIYPEGGRGGRGKTREKITGLPFDRTNVSRARTVLRYAPDLSANVLGGSVSLDNAYQEAAQRKKDASGDVARLAAIRAGHPDIADKVVEGELTLAGAEAEAGERDTIEREGRAMMLRVVGDACRSLVSLGNDGFLHDLIAKMDDVEFRRSVADTVGDAAEVGAGAENLAVVLSHTEE